MLEKTLAQNSGTKLLSPGVQSTCHKPGLLRSRSLTQCHETRRINTGGGLFGFYILL